MSGLRWASVLEDNPLVLMDRVKGHDAANITQASINAISFRVWRYASLADLKSGTNPTEVGTSASLTVANVVFDALQTADEAWTANGGDAAGYNFKTTIPKARFATAGYHAVEILFDPAAAGEEDFRIAWGVRVDPVASE